MKRTLLFAVFMGAAAAGAVEGGGGQSEGIGVHGEWTVEVLNPDGSLAARHQFENALVEGSGDVYLARHLSRTAPTPSTWNVEVGEATPDGSGAPCTAGTPPVGVRCRMRELPGGDASPTLTLAVAGGTLRLTGTVTATKDAPQLARFATYVDWFGGGKADFTEKRLPAPIPVVAGQIIKVTVVFSFS